MQYGTEMYSPFEGISGIGLLRICCFHVRMRKCGKSSVLDGFCLFIQVLNESYYGSKTERMAIH